MLLQVFRHFVHWFEQAREHFCIALYQRVGFIYDIEIGVAVVSVHGYFYRVADIVLTVENGFPVGYFCRIRIFVGGGVGVNHPYQAAFVHHQIRVGVKGQERSDFFYTVQNITVQQNFAVAGNQVGEQNFIVGAVQREQCFIHKVHRDTGIALVLGLGIAVAHRIVKFRFFCVYNNIIVGQLAVIDFRTGDFQLWNFTDRRNIFHPHFRLALAGYLVYRRYNGTVAVCVFQIFVYPGLGAVIQAALVQFAGRQVHLLLTAVNIVTVDVNVYKFVVQAHTLQLVEYGAGRAVVD